MGEILRRPGGRTERIRQDVAAAVLTLIQQGKLNFEIQDVVALSGAARATVFRRWPTRAALLREGLTAHAAEFLIQHSSDWLADLRINLLKWRDFLKDPAQLALNRIYLQSDDEELKSEIWAHFEPLIESFALPMMRAQAKGKIRADVDVPQLVDSIFGDMAYRSMVRPLSMDDAFLEGLADRIERGIAAASLID
jgi:AcrR family transcriptional regulator